jgi:transposase
MRNDGTGLAEVLVGIPGFQICAAIEERGELLILVETTVDRAFCSSCGARAEAKDRLSVIVRDLPMGGRPTCLVWRKRRWECAEILCPKQTWTEEHQALPPGEALTTRAGFEACRAVGQEGRSVAALARWLRVAWSTVMSAVRRHGEPLVEDPSRVGPTDALGIDETAFLKAKARHPTQYVTGIVDLNGPAIVDLVEGHSAEDLRHWLARQDQGFLDGVTTVACDLHEGFRAGLHPFLDHARQVADPFHVIAAANRCVDGVRRRVQQETTGHRGRRDDPLYRIRRVLLTGAERLDDRGQRRMALGLRLGDPGDEVLGAWLAKEYLRDVYLVEDPGDAALLLDRVIEGARREGVPEIASLGRTLSRWRAQILAHHETGASNGPTEAMNLLVKKIKRCGHGFRSFPNYRLRVLLHCGGIKWEDVVSARMRGLSPQSNA